MEELANISGIAGAFFLPLVVSGVQIDIVGLVSVPRVITISIPVGLMSGLDLILDLNELGFIWAVFGMG